MAGREGGERMKSITSWEGAEVRGWEGAEVRVGRVQK